MVGDKIKISRKKKKLIHKIDLKFQKYFINVYVKINNQFYVYDRTRKGLRISYFNNLFCIKAMEPPKNYYKSILIKFNKR